ncbi:hypothetical protein LY78DRAFT_153298 [Colletotrichum sublineola]|nr:hypothetical protein LY78DRAFT_153298 [Colletotrichum sublineola]
MMTHSPLSNPTHHDGADAQSHASSFAVRTPPKYDPGFRDKGWANPLRLHTGHFIRGKRGAARHWPVAVPHRIGALGGWHPGRLRRHDSPTDSPAQSCEAADLLSWAACRLLTLLTEGLVSSRSAQILGECVWEATSWEGPLRFVDDLFVETLPHTRIHLLRPHNVVSKNTSPRRDYCPLGRAP